MGCGVMGWAKHPFVEVVKAFKAVARLYYMRLSALVDVLIRDTN